MESRESNISVYCIAVKETGCGPPAGPPPSPRPPPHLLPSRGETGAPSEWDAPPVGTTGTNESETGILGTKRQDKFNTFESMRFDRGREVGGAGAHL